jgi:hypothetical protein
MAKRWKKIGGAVSAVWYKSGVVICICTTNTYHWGRSYDYMNIMSWIIAPSAFISKLTVQHIICTYLLCFCCFFH